MTRMLFVAAIASAQASEFSHAADISPEAKAAVEEAVTGFGCSMDVGDEIAANGDGYKAEYVLCEDGPYYLSSIGTKAYQQGEARLSGLPWGRSASTSAL